HFIPRPGHFGHDTWPADAWKTAGGANNWAGMALDAERGIVFAPTGSAVDDFYGADRLGDNLFANSLVAIDAASGRRLWHFQGVHHDIWDRDFPSPPQLLTVTHQGRRIDAVAQTSKQGFVYLFERETGQPLFPIKERAVAASTVPGEVAARTQPFPTAPEPFARQRLTAEGLSDRSPAINAWARRAFAALISGPQFTPFSVDRQTVLFPGFDGGAEWGGAASDPRGVIYVNSNDIAWLGGLSSNSDEVSWGESTYRSQCAVCHGVDRRGSPPEFPSLLGVGDRLSASRIGAILDHGGGRMPAFPAIKGDERRELIAWLTGATGQNREAASAGSRQTSTYSFTGYRKFTDPDGYPAVAPPWGTLNAIDLNTGRYLWRVPLGEYPALAAQGVPTTGTENYGGPVVTAGGVLFIGATIHDRLFRAFDRRNGRLLWQAPLPYAGVATPATYMVDGRQYVVIAASGARDQTGPQGSAYVAFALPRR
ncbi:MAG: quinoprotein glucose dehydrogenase, partial [Brevundimonas sp.]